MIFCGYIVSTTPCYMVEAWFARNSEWLSYYKYDLCAVSSSPPVLLLLLLLPLLLFLHRLLLLFSPHPWGTDDLLQLYVHPVVTVHKVAIVCLSILELHQLEEVGIVKEKWRERERRKGGREGGGGEGRRERLSVRDWLKGEIEMDRKDQMINSTLSYVTSSTMGLFWAALRSDNGS